MIALNDLSDLVPTIARRVAERRNAHPLCVAMSGIDGSGKTSLAARMAEELRGRSLGVALLHLDPWHTPPEVRFGTEQPGQHFYEHAFRWDDLFRLVIEPLQRDRSLHITAAVTRLPENDIHPHLFSFEDVDVILLEGIFLLKRALRPRYDLTIWVECSFETALARALRRVVREVPQSAITSRSLSAGLHPRRAWLLDAALHGASGLEKSPPRRGAAERHLRVIRRGPA